MFFFSMALVIERKKLSPEARKQTRASKSRKTTSNNYFSFPDILFTIALVIERNTLSPEARKQTRATESLKITSKNQFYVSHHFVYYSPGDRAQKVIPGGAKTNESFCKSQNDVEKLKFSFPIIFVYYSPGDRAQKVIPGGAKTNESF